MILPPFRLHRPASLAEAASVLASFPPGEVDLLAGGSDLLPNYKNRLNPRPQVVSLADVPELHQLTPHSIGAMVSLHRLASEAGYRDRFAGLVEAASQIASAPLRRQATCGGNLLVETRCFWFNQGYDWRVSEGFCLKADGDICRVVLQKDTCYAMYPGELAPNLMVLDARLRLLSASGERRVPVREFFRPDGIAKHVLAPGEILVSIEIPERGTPSRTGYAKLAVRRSVDFAEAGMACGLDLEGDRVVRLELAATALDMMPVYLGDLKSRFEGRVPDAAFLRELAAAVPERVNPVKNTFLSPEYRRRMAGVLAKRLVARLASATD